MHILDEIPARTPVLGTTATANDRVVADVSAILGAQMNIQSDALEALCPKTRRGFETALKAADAPNDPKGDPRWKKVSHFLMTCSEEIGREAAARAKADFVVAIRQKHVKTAYQDVSGANKEAGAGEFCPDWP